jgi:hypothetical protein
MNTLMIITTLLCTLVAVEPKEMLPGLWVEDGVVLFDAKVAIDCHHPETPDVYLEMLITGPDTREHESLLVSEIKPSSLHAALLAAGIEPGSPVSFDDEGNRVPASGDHVKVEIQIESDEEWMDLAKWVVHVDEGTGLIEDAGWSGLVFAGSKTVSGKGYLADREGSLVSLTPWGHEVISPVWTLSPDASVDEPVWIADRKRIPEIGVEVRVRIHELDEEIGSE